MARKRYAGITATQCPYYISESDTFIACEGYESSTIEYKRFKTEKQKMRHQSTYCFDVNRFSDCSHCILMDAKYKLIEDGLRDDDERTDDAAITPRYNLP